MVPFLIPRMGLKVNDQECDILVKASGWEFHGLVMLSLFGRSYTWSSFSFYIEKCFQIFNFRSAKSAIKLGSGQGPEGCEELSKRYARYAFFVMLLWWICIGDQLTTLASCMKKNTIARLLDAARVEEWSNSSKAITYEEFADLIYGPRLAVGDSPQEAQEWSSFG